MSVGPPMRSHNLILAVCWSAGLGLQVFGQILLSNWKTKGSGGVLFNSWVPNVWNSYCFLASNQTMTVQAFLNNENASAE